MVDVVSPDGPSNGSLPNAPKLKARKALLPNKDEEESMRRKFRHWTIPC
jgi:hypothetical protein